MYMKCSRCGIAVVLMVAAVTVVSGCGQALVGSWKTDPIPKDESFYLIQTKFKDDGTFEASANENGETVTLRGTYDFDGFRLKLKSPGKPDRQYNATYVLGGKLQLRHDKTQLTMKKQ